jgi:hypothetical protein
VAVGKLITLLQKLLQNETFSQSLAVERITEREGGKEAGSGKGFK